MLAGVSRPLRSRINKEVGVKLIHMVRLARPTLVIGGVLAQETQPDRTTAEDFAVKVYDVSALGACPEGWPRLLQTND